MNAIREMIFFLQKIGEKHNSDIFAQKLEIHFDLT